MCLVAANTGLAINDYARTLGVVDGTLVAPDVGGAALTSDLRIVDLAGLTDARMAAFWHDDDWAGLRDHVFDDVRPAFIRGHGLWLSITGIAEDPRMATGWVEVDRNGGSTDWVRRDLVAGPGQLAAVRAAGAAAAAERDARYRDAPRSSCGQLTTGSSR
jgi:hypothetical protein